MLFDIVLHKKLPSFGLDIALRSDARRLAVVGPSGSGKSLTLQLLAGLLKPDGGHIRVNGGTWFDERINLPAQKRRVGLLFQDYALFPHLTVAQNIDFGLARGLSNPSKRPSEKAQAGTGGRPLSATDFRRAKTAYRFGAGLGYRAGAVAAGRAFFCVGRRFAHAYAQRSVADSAGKRYSDDFDYPRQGGCRSAGGRSMDDGGGQAGSGRNKCGLVRIAAI